MWSSPRSSLISSLNHSPVLWDVKDSIDSHTRDAGCGENKKKSYNARKDSLMLSAMHSGSKSLGLNLARNKNTALCSWARQIALTYSVPLFALINGLQQIYWRWFHWKRSIWNLLKLCPLSNYDNYEHHKNSIKNGGDDTHLMVSMVTIWSMRVFITEPSNKKRGL